MYQKYTKSTRIHSNQWTRTNKNWRVKQTFWMCIYMWITKLYHYKNKFSFSFILNRFISRANLILSLDLTRNSFFFRILIHQLRHKLVSWGRSYHKTKFAKILAGIYLPQTILWHLSLKMITHVQIFNPHLPIKNCYICINDVYVGGLR